MKDFEIILEDRPGALARMGEALGRAGVSIEGGGAFTVDGRGVAHFLFADEEPARTALTGAGIEVRAVRDVVVQRLNQGEPGQMGKLARAMAEAGVNLHVVYSDHQNQLVVAPDDLPRAQEVASKWQARGREQRHSAHVRWEGDTSAGYAGYTRNHVLEAAGKAAIASSADARFRGDATRWNPEELLVGALAACHQLWFLHLCADAGVAVTAYEDHAEGTLLVRADGSGELTQVTLRPRATFRTGAERAHALHARAHALCFLASSVRFPVRVEL